MNNLEYQLELAKYDEQIALLNARLKELELERTRFVRKSIENVLYTKKEEEKRGNNAG